MESGFALIVTISLMVLLTLLAVGLLSLSSINLRSAGQTSKVAQARANARLALMMAIGDLQKLAGVDQRITARSDIRDEHIQNPRLTGVWTGWELDVNSPPTASDYDEGSKDREFLGWLASSRNIRERQQADYATKELTDPVEVLGKGTLGELAKDEDIVQVEKMLLSSSSGGMAWAVFDEGVKARINTPYSDEPETDAQKMAQLGSGVRANTSSITGLEALDRSKFKQDSHSYSQLAKSVTRNTLHLAAEEVGGTKKEEIEPLFHDISTESSGILADVANGGLKEDLNLALSGDVAEDFKGKGVYETLLDLDDDADPSWDTFAEFANLFTSSGSIIERGDMPTLRATAPRTWLAARGSNPNTGNPGRVTTVAPDGALLMPNIAKVQIVFSLLTRDIYNYSRTADTAGMPGSAPENPLHSPWGENFRGSQYDYLLHLLYTPVVTLHNPYNVALEFSQFKVNFGNVPFALKIYRNRVAQTADFAPLDTMYYQQSETGRQHKRFGMSLKTNAGNADRPRPGSTTFRLLPGEVMMFSPYIDPDRTWAQEYQNRTFSDWDTGSGATRTLTIDAIPGWRGDGIGFDLDWFCPSYAKPSSTYEREGSKQMHRGGCIGARRQDEFYVEFAPLSVPNLSQNKYTIELFGQTAGSKSQSSLVVVEMDYESPTGLQELLLGERGRLRYPPDGTINALEMHSHSQTPIKEIATAKPFAVVSAQAKATYGGLEQSGEDGRLATMPWAFAHASVGAASQKMLSEHHANHSHEFDITMLENGTTNLMQYDPETGRGNAITGQTGATGRKFGIMYEIPFAPLQSFSQLNGYNPGGSTIHLPRFAQPIGNSWAHPLLPSHSLKQQGTTGPMLDHSFLLNTAFYDRFYFSGLADHGGAYGDSSLTKDKLAQDFADGEPLTDPRFFFAPPTGKTESDFLDVVDADDGYRQLAAWQKFKGAFNINSTSVEAWKAMLSSVHDDEAVFNRIDESGESTSLANLPQVDSKANETRISRFRLPASESVDDASQPLQAYWLGPREYSEDEIETLAERIVEQVRERGPFRSMSEFVNRQLNSGDAALCGALQQAIDESRLNESVANENEAGFAISSSQVDEYHYAFPEAGTGLSSRGAPGHLSQADLLTVLGNAATPRSDTFTIRAYGEVTNEAGQTIASAMCEAVVQRDVEYLDPEDEPHIKPDELSSEVNKTMGRRYDIVSFRWLTKDEI